MYKKVTVRKDVEETHRYCDVCGVEILRCMACSVAKCACCGKDLCNACVGHEGYASGDYRVVYCRECWDIGDDFREKIAYLEEQIEHLYAEWKSRCNCSE